MYCDTHSFHVYSDKYSHYNTHFSHACIPSETCYVMSSPWISTICIYLCNEHRETLDSRDCSSRLKSPMTNVSTYKGPGGDDSYVPSISVSQLQEIICWWFAPKPSPREERREEADVGGYRGASVLPVDVRPAHIFSNRLTTGPSLVTWLAGYLDIELHAELCHGSNVRISATTLWRLSLMSCVWAQIWRAWLLASSSSHVCYRFCSYATLHLVTGHVVPPDQKASAICDSLMLVQPTRYVRNVFNFSEDGRNWSFNFIILYSILKWMGKWQ